MVYICYPNLQLMKLSKYKTITFLLVILVVLTILGNLFQVQILSEVSWILILSTLLVSYYINQNKKNILFTTFLVGFALSEVLKLWFITSEIIYYYLSYVCVMVAYSSLIIFFLKGIEFKKLIKNFKLHLIILSFFNLYILYTLNEMILHDETVEVFTFIFFIEVVYNVLILLMLSISLLYYLHNESKQSLLLFLACVCIVFSEMIQVAYVFITAEIFLRICYSLLMAIGFGFIYFYTLLEVKSHKLITQ